MFNHLPIHLAHFLSKMTYKLAKVPAIYNIAATNINSTALQIFRIIILYYIILLYYVLVARAFI